MKNPFWKLLSKAVIASTCEALSWFTHAHVKIAASLALLAMTYVNCATALEYLSEPVVAYVNHTKATIEWETNEVSQGLVQYGQEKNNLDLKEKSEWRTFHKMNLNGLIPNTTYYFRISSEDKDQKKRITTIYSFKTHIQLETLVPRLTSTPKLTQISPQEISISWRTSIPTTATIHYGTGDALNQKKQILFLHEEHEAEINDLLPGHKYSFQIVSESSSGDTRKSAVMTYVVKEFKKLGEPPRLEEDPTVSQISDTSAVIEIHLTHEIPVIIKYDTGESLSLLVSSTAPKTMHQIKLTGLKKDTLYHYRIYHDKMPLTPTYTFRTGLL